MRQAKQLLTKMYASLRWVVLNALHSVDKEFVNKGTLRTFKASDDEKFQISSDHFNQFCTPPHLDENAEEGLTLTS